MHLVLNFAQIMQSGKTSLQFILVNQVNSTVVLMVLLRLELSLTNGMQLSKIEFAVLHHLQALAEIGSTWNELNDHQQGA